MKDGKSLSLRFLKKLLCLLTSNLAIMQSIGILVPSSLWWSFPLFQRKFLIPCSYCDNDTLGWICVSIYDYWVLFWTFHLEIRLLLFWGDFFRKSCGNISAYLFSIIFFQYLQIRGWILCFNPMYPFQKLLFFPLLIKISVFCPIVWEVSSISSSKSSNEFVILILIILGSAGKDKMQEMWVWSLSWEDPLEESIDTHSSTLAWEIPRFTEQPGGFWSMDLWLILLKHDILVLVSWTQHFCSLGYYSLKLALICYFCFLCLTLCVSDANTCLLISSSDPLRFHIPEWGTYRPVDSFVWEAGLFDLKRGGLVISLCSFSLG